MTELVLMVAISTFFEAMLIFVDAVAPDSKVSARQQVVKFVQVSTPALARRCPLLKLRSVLSDS